MRKHRLVISISFLFVLLSFLTQHQAHAASLSDVKVEKVDRVVQPIYGGLVLVNDTIEISTMIENVTIEDFIIGFPIEYRTNLQFSIACNADDQDEKLDVTLDGSLGITGYFGVTVVFPHTVREQLQSGQSYTFRVTSLFTDLMDSSSKMINGTTENVFEVDFPLYPSLTCDALTCNVEVILPKETRPLQDHSPFNSSLIGEVYHLNHTKMPLTKLSRVFSRISFITEDTNSFSLFLVSKITRENVIDSEGQISVSELLLLKSRNAFTTSNIRLSLPRDASDVSAFDEQGNKLTAQLLEDDPGVYEISLYLIQDQFRSLRVTYHLQQNRSDQQDSGNLVTIDLSENLKIMPNVFSISIVFPEGASIQSYPLETFDLQKDAFQEELHFSLTNVTWLQNRQWSFTYEYSIFWTSFRPTLWATTIVIVGITIALAWQRPKAPAIVSPALIPREILNEFVENYEEKKKAVLDLEEIERKAKKRKVSRREYKIKKRTLENRLSTLSNKLNDLRQKIEVGGAKYADIMRQLEVSEAQLENIEADIKRIEFRFKRGEISAQTFRRLRENDLRRQERTKTTIDGLLLRLRE